MERQVSLLLTLNRFGHFSSDSIANFVPGFCFLLHEHNTSICKVMVYWPSADQCRSTVVLILSGFSDIFFSVTY